MIVYDTPQRYYDTPFHKDVVASHVMSTLLGDEGTAELLAWAATVGLSPGYIQLRGAPREHFDVWGVPLEKLQASDVPCVQPRALVAIIRAKREGFSLVPRWSPPGQNGCWVILVSNADEGTWMHVGDTVGDALLATLAAWKQDRALAY